MEVEGENSTTRAEDIYTCSVMKFPWNGPLFVHGRGGLNTLGS